MENSGMLVILHKGVNQGHIFLVVNLKVFFRMHLTQ